MRANFITSCAVALLLSASTLTYAAGASLWGNVDAPDESTAPAPAPSTAPIIDDNQTAVSSDPAPSASDVSTDPADDPITTDASASSAPSAAAPDAPTTAPVADPATVPTTTKTGTKSTKATKTTKAPASKNANKKGTAVTSATTPALTDIDAPLTNPAAQQTICELFMQQPSLKDDPLYKAKTRDEVTRQASVVEDEYAFLLRDPETANTLYTQYRDLYIKNYCSK